MEEDPRHQHFMPLVKATMPVGLRFCQIDSSIECEHGRRHGTIGKCPADCMVRAYMRHERPARLREYVERDALAREAADQKRAKREMDAARKRREALP